MFSAPSYFYHDDLSLAYYCAGDADCPTLFLLHGFCMDAVSNWDKTGWVEKLIDRYRVVGLDIRGHGASDKPHNAEAYPANIMATDVIALADHLNVDSFSVIGYSMGARMATFLASAHPTRINKLVIAAQAESLLAGVNGTDAIAFALKAPSLRAVKHKKLRQFRMLAEMKDNDLTALAYCIDAPSKPITKEDLDKISAKALIIAGDEDQIAGDPKKIADYFPQAEAKVIAGCNHFTALTHSDFIAHAITFIKSSTLEK